MTPLTPVGNTSVNLSTSWSRFTEPSLIADIIWYVCKINVRDRFKKSPDVFRLKLRYYLWLNVCVYICVYGYLCVCSWKYVCTSVYLCLEWHSSTINSTKPNTIPRYYYTRMQRGNTMIRNAFGAGLLWNTISIT